MGSLINATGKEIVWTSGATESNNLAIKGIAKYYERNNEGKTGHIITVLTEHKAVLDACKALMRDGWDVIFLEVESDGRICLDDLKAFFREDTVLVSVMYANNEIGVIQPIAEIGAIVSEARKSKAGTEGGVSLRCSSGIGSCYCRRKSFSDRYVEYFWAQMYGPKGIGMLRTSWTPQNSFGSLN